MNELNQSEGLEERDWIGETKEWLKEFNKSPHGDWYNEPKFIELEEGWFNAYPFFLQLTLAPGGGLMIEDTWTKKGLGHIYAMHLKRSKIKMLNMRRRYMNELKTEKTAQSWDCGATPGTVTATLSEDGTLKIIGKGDMANYFARKDVTWKHVKRSIIRVAIEDGVMSIGDWAFSFCENLASVTIPDSVKSIGFQAFRNCDGLTSVTIPNGVNIIKDGAFACCGGLKSVTIGSGVKDMGLFVFIGSRLESLIILRKVLLNNWLFDLGAYVDECRVYVPKSVLAAYREAEGWKDFGSIMEVESL